MSLREDIARMQAGLIPNIPKNALDTIISTTEKLVKSGIADKAKNVGDTAPPFELKATDDTQVSLDSLLAKGPAVISFYRGSWCPYCNLELKALANVYPELKSNGAELVSISPNLAKVSKVFIQGNPLPFKLLSDAGNHVARDYGLTFNLAEELRPIYKTFGFDIPTDNGDESWEIPIPATYVVSTDGKIVAAYVNADYTTRMEPADILTALDKL